MALIMLMVTLNGMEHMFNHMRPAIRVQVFIAMTTFVLSHIQYFDIGYCVIAMNEKAGIRIFIIFGARAKK